MIDDTSNNLGLVLQKITAEPDLLPEIRENEVHLWCLPLKLDAGQHKNALKLLSDHQKDKYQRRKTDLLKSTYLAGRYYLWQLLTRYTGQPIDQLRLKYNRLNKPALQPNAKRLQFNYTDTFIDEDSAIGIYAFSLNQAVGVDLESLNRQGNFQRVLDKRFSMAEQAYVNEDPEQKNQRFLQLWTRKEAFGKAKGIGINFTMRELDLFSSSHNLSFKCDQHRDWQLLQIQPDKQTIACVVREGNKPFDCQLFTQFIN